MEWNPKLGAPFVGQNNITGFSGSVAPMQPGGAHIQIAWSWNIRMKGQRGGPPLFQ
jgi:hypothetical protein